MENGIVLLAVLIVVVWYFGSAIKSVLAGAGQMASSEFDQLQADQIVNNRKRDQVRSVKFEELFKDTNILSAKDIINTYNSDVTAHNKPEKD